ncbi:MAG: DUF4365 domain-containing protein [Lachnotalea sp.]
MKLPMYSKEKKQGNIAADILKKNLQKIAIVNGHDESIDLGIDMRAQIIKDGEPLPLFFNIQCKGKEIIEEDEIKKDYFSICIKTATINFWRQQNEVTFLFVVDNDTEKCFWVNPLKILESRIDEIQNQDSVSVKVPLCNIIDNKINAVPMGWIEDILIYMATQQEQKVELLENTVLGVTENYSLDITTTVSVLKELKKNADNINNSYFRICETLIKSIKNQIEETLDSAHELDQMDEIVRRWCPDGVFLSTSFSKKKKSIRELEREMYSLIETFHNNKDDFTNLDKLVECDMDMEDILLNVGGFLYEMACEDNPFGNHEKLYEMTFGRRRKY